MAYRRRQQPQQQEILASAAADDLVDVEVDAAKAIRASSAHKDSSLSSAYGYGSLHSSSASPLSTPTPTPKVFSLFCTTLYIYACYNLLPNDSVEIQTFLTGYSWLLL